jgi:hypothetical protein
MRKLPLVLALSCVSWGFAGMASAESLKASDCRPLTSANAEACCSAANLRALLSPQDEALCPARPTQTVVSPAPATALGSPPDTTPPDDTNPPGALGVNNGFGNGDETAPGSSGPNNNAENATPSRGSGPGNSGTNTDN